MRVSDEHQVLFVHIPKNAGSTVDAIFDDEVPDSRRVGNRARHVRYKGLVRTEPGLADYWSFSFVRNPWARMVSWYVMMAKIFEQYDAGRPYSVGKIDKFPHVWEPVRPFVGDFETFVTGAPDAIRRFGRPQHDWLVLEDGREVDFVGRVENFAHDIDVVRKRLGLPPAEVVPRNRSSHAHYSEYYTDHTRERVADLFAVDIETWGYTFDRPD